MSLKRTQLTTLLRMVKTEHKGMIYAALRLNDSSYHQLVFDTGLEWIRQRWSLNDEGVVYTTAKSEQFWKWWRNQWELRDAQFVYETQLERLLPLEKEYQALCLELYYDLHKAQNIRVIPNRFVIADVGKLLKEYTLEEIERLKLLVHGKK